jgi:hypothetical protein
MTKNTAYAALWAKAVKAGEAAAASCTPTPMIVGTAKNPLFGDEIDRSKTMYFVPEGLCGFASIRFKGNTGFGRWAKANGLAEKSYSGGLYYWVSGYGQSYERKSAYASAFAATLQSGGISDAYSESRLD